MRFSTPTAVAVLAGASVAVAQTSPLALAQGLLAELTPRCQATVVSIANSTSPFYQCLHVEGLLPILMTNGSVLPPLDMYLSTVCSSAPCTADVLNSTAQTLLSGCSTDLSLAGISNDTIYEIMDLYPLAREIACLKTTSPMALANATIPVNSTSYNSTNGTFCVTEVLTDLSGYFGTNLTNTFIDTALLGGNTSALDVISSIPPQAFCSDCVVAALELVELEYPSVGNASLGYFKGANGTLNEMFNMNCAAIGLSISSNGTLPSNITESAVNTTFPFSITAGNMTYPAGNATIPMLNATAASAIVSAAAETSGAMSEKRRWFGY